MCPMCDRTTNHHIKNIEFEYEQFKTHIDDVFIRQISSILFCGNHGDPIISNHTLPILHHLRETNPQLHIDLTTNGGARTSKFWKELAKLDVQVTFSVDGLADTNDIYRVNVNWDILEASMDAFTQAGGKGKWVYLIFEHNEHQIEEAEQVAKLFGLQFIRKKTGRWVQAYKQEKITEKKTVKGHKIKPAKKEEHQNTSVNKYNGLVKSHGTFDNYLDSTKITCKTLQSNEIYISAEGLVMPCCWTASRLYKVYEKIGQNQIWSYIDDVNNINVLHKPLKDIIEGNFFKQLQESWSLPTCSQGKSKVCAEKCGIGFDAFGDQWA
jgi:hypothetical protein